MSLEKLSFSLVVTEDQHIALKRLAYERGVTVSRLFREAIDAKRQRDKET